jgi:hypothetical protein
MARELISGIKATSHILRKKGRFTKSRDDVGRSLAKNAKRTVKKG